MRRRHLRRAWLAGLITPLVMLVVMIGGWSLVGGDREEAPASHAALQRIEAKNREAAIVSAAQLKAESNAAVAAANARALATTEGDAAGPLR